MNFLEKFAIGFLGVVESTVPIFIHSSSGVIIMNASENIVNGVLAAAIAAATPEPAPTPISVAAPAVSPSTTPVTVATLNTTEPVTFSTTTEAAA